MIYERALCCVDMLSLKNPLLCQKIAPSCVNISCLEDRKLKAKHYKCEIASISFVLALLCKMTGESEFKDLDEGYLSAESCFGEEEADEIIDFLYKAEYIIIDENIAFHKDSENIKYCLHFLSEKFALTILNTQELQCDFKTARSTKLKELDNYDGLVLFKANLQDEALHCSKQFLQLSKCKNESTVELSSKDFSLKTTLLLDENLQGTIGFLHYENQGYDFNQIRIKEANDNYNKW
ncbi:hypothetical protein OQH60_01955 [Campylobacter sp. MIT 21-1685]|uniref:hypothetical protein n=1 Tax=unclassified Campylobacter TaxID=2593542 RepID=UPI00224B38BF|nr:MULTISPECIES: hypothetical protein [unclassified Campylobacter]MCX2682665.1 hypothetical protein [Campylobacter sp. MIT 21-1684]MCX2750945.1 hypothetical protein [Campylobacter sp. MIT 21-1682]MCX2807122.1 hypothetical protein [Campylobacter sp. MIT 21-1685]